MFIALITTFVASSGGATYKCLYAAPELGRFGYSNAINITRLWRSRMKTLIPTALICTPFVSLQVSIHQADYPITVGRPD
jgi:hypothetical protein